MTAPELKRCPFCGGDAIKPRNDHARMWVIACSKCNSEVWEKNDGHYDHDFIPMISYAWNRRITPTLSDALALPEVAALVEAAKVIADRNKFANPMRSADMHKGNCQCARCHYDALDAALDALSTPPADGDKA